MNDYEFPKVPEIEVAYRAAHRTLECIIPQNDGLAAESELNISEVIGQFSNVAEKAYMAVAAQLGPHISWEVSFDAERENGPLRLVTTGTDLDTGERDFGVRLSESAYQGDTGRWRGSSLDRAARAYQGACGWDFAPGQAGLWLLTLAPVWGWGADNEWSYTGHLAGFVIIYDRDDDGTYESVGHIWTATAWRRRGIARRLLQEARERFAAQQVEGPYTEDGTAFVAACWDGKNPGGAP